MTGPTELVELFPDGNVADVPAMLRGAAAAVESETDEDDRTEAFVAVQLHESGEIQVYAWGRTDSLRAIGTLHLGAAWLEREMLG
jgi:hypothetical protein